MRCSKHRAVLRASADPGEGGHFIINGHAAIQVKSRPEIKPYSVQVLREAICKDISTRAMMEYFKPLMSWLEEQNKGRQIGWE